MKLRNKLFLDATLFVLIWFVMSYDFTGGFLHELIGVLLIVGFLLHILLNRKYYVLMTKKLFQGAEIGGRKKVSYAVNVLLLAALAFMLISSVAISKNLLPSVSAWFSHYAAWRTIHIISAIAIVVCMAVHLFLHATLFDSIVKKRFKGENVTMVMRVISCAMALCIVMGVLKVSIKNLQYIHSGEKNNSYGKTEQSITIGVNQEDTETITTPSQQEETVSDIPSLNDFLKGLRCDGCGRHCSLLSPQCGKGDRRAEQAKEEYYSTYYSEE